MKEISVSGQMRATTGKKASKEMRKEGLVPCNLYGEKKGENGAPRKVLYLVTFMVRRRVRTVHLRLLHLQSQHHSSVA